MVAEKTLELEARKLTFETVKDNPGIHLREIDRIAGIPLGTIRYHLRVLEKKKLITVRKEGKYMRYYAKGEIDRSDKDRLAVLRKELPRTIILFLMEYPDSSHKEITEVLDVAPSTISYHMKRLIKDGMVDKREKGYFVVDEDKIADLLIQYRQTFLDSLVDRFVRIWTKGEG